MAQAQAAVTSINLRGSVEIVAEFLDYAVNSILYQRALYPPEQFTRVSKYGLTMLVANDEKLKVYLQGVLGHVKTWLLSHSVQKVVLVIVSVDTGETMERWTFDVQTDKAVTSEAAAQAQDLNKINKEIQAIIRQITASVTYLPLLSDACAFDLLVYTDSEVPVPKEWEESDPKMISDSSEVRLRSFSTHVHKIDTMVAYRNPVASG